jgi:hypothetical protein
MRHPAARLLAVVALATICRAQEAVPDEISTARGLMHKGLLRAAEDLLEPIFERSGAEPQDASRSQADLLLGNIAFERGKYRSALRDYEAVLADPSASAASRQAARSNADRSRVLLLRAQSLAQASRRLAVAVAVTALLGAAVCAWLARRALPMPTAR